jgi:Fic family protein
MYIHNHSCWTDFKWNEDIINPILSDVRYSQGKLLGRMSALGFDLRAEATLKTLTHDVIKTSEIEGESLDAAQVRSSIAKRLGIDSEESPYIEQDVEGIVDVLLDAIHQYDAPLTKDRLFNWHASLFPTGRRGIQFINVGSWRTKSSGDMQVVSAAYGRERIHFEAPKYDRLENEMTKFVNWFNAEDKEDLVIKSGIAHFWFVTVHPFDDGNGRIARAISDMVLAKSEQSEQRFYSMSSQIRKDRKVYYDILEQCQKGSSDITLWIEWFLLCLKRAIEGSEQLLDSVLVKARFWETHTGKSLNPRQKLIINRLLEGFKGNLNTSKWAKITKCSQDTALRDIHNLIDINILKKEGAGGRSTRYSILVPPTKKIGENNK